MRGMRDRAHRVSDPSSKPKELQHLDEVFQANGFPTHLVKKTLTTSPKVPHTEDLELTEPRGTLYIPYICGLSERRICAPVLMQVESRVPEEKKKGIVYQVPCKDCDEAFIDWWVQKNIESSTDRTQVCSGEKWCQQRYRSACGQEWTQYWMGKHESGDISERIWEGEPPKPSESDPARTPRTWTMA